MKRKRVTGDEQDLFTAWRHVYRWQRGERKRIRRWVAKRERREGRAKARREAND